MRFNSGADNSTLFGITANAIEQDRLADAAQPVKDKTPGRPPGANAVQGHGSTLDKFVASCKLGRRRADSGRIGILPWIHIKQSYLGFRESHNLAKLVISQQASRTEPRARRHEVAPWKCQFSNARASSGPSGAGRSQVVVTSTNPPFSPEFRMPVITSTA